MLKPEISVSPLKEFIFSRSREYLTFSITCTRYRTQSHIEDPILLCTLSLNRFHIYIIAENVKLYTSRRSTEAQNIKAMFIYHFSRIPLIKGFCRPPQINPPNVLNNRGVSVSQAASPTPVTWLQLQ